MNWHLSHRFDPRAVALADRHYNRQTIGAPQFVPPGRCLVLLTARAGALWVSSWQDHVRHAYPGAWVNTLFRNEGDVLSSRLITDAVAATRWWWGPPPSHLAYPFITFIDADKVRPKRDPGYCYLQAGWEQIGVTPYASLLVLGLRCDRFPAAEPPAGAQYILEALA